ncbi:MAG: CHC2 zinc finger domain-containing protein, partial [Candidatus Cloacimonetes bacterium]|nr:CHC2 zinc finger domain-containing protein [Candidatus Cloacimonadota bacterium]
MIPQEVIDNINNIPILDVASKLNIDVKKAGVNYVCHCPAHTESTPSFTISPAKNICKCFGCGVGGGPVQLVMLQDKIEWIDAIKLLAKEFNIRIPQKDYSPEEKQQFSDREQIMVTNQAVLKYFTSNLKGDALGYATNRWNEES